MPLTRDETVALIEQYAAGPDILRQALDQVPAAVLRWRPAPSEWSAHEWNVPQYTGCDSHSVDEYRR